MKVSTQQWLEFAKIDLLSCEKILDDDLLTSVVAFHSQQAVEKCFKAVIEENNLTIPRIHNLLRLYQIIGDFFELTLEKKDLLALDEIYTNSRYPINSGLISTGKPSLEDARTFYESATKIYEQVFRNLV